MGCLDLNEKSLIYSGIDYFLGLHCENELFFPLYMDKGDVRLNME